MSQHDQQEFVFNETTTSLAIREFMLKRGETYPAEFYRAFRAVRPKTTYKNITWYFWILRRLKLIERTRTEPGKGIFPRQYHRIVPGRENDPRWHSPQKYINRHSNNTNTVRDANPGVTSSDKTHP